MLQETEELITKEKELKNQKLSEQMDKLSKKHEDEIERIKTQYDELIAVTEKKRREEADQYISKLKEVQEQNVLQQQKIRAELEERNQQTNLQEKQELQVKAEKIAQEKQAWIKEQQKIMDETMSQKLAAHKKEMEKDRDKQIQIIISKLSEESNQAEI